MATIFVVARFFAKSKSYGAVCRRGSYMDQKLHFKGYNSVEAFLGETTFARVIAFAKLATDFSQLLA
jgi:hypothetical protein